MAAKGQRKAAKKGSPDVQSAGTVSSADCGQPAPRHQAPGRTGCQLAAIDATSSWGGPQGKGTVLAAKAVEHAKQTPWQGQRLTRQLLVGSPSRYLCGSAQRR